jgi:hypothetical protein
MEALEILFFLNKLIMVGFDVADRVNRGDMTKAEGIAAIVATATNVKEQNARFDRLTGGAP